MVHTTRIVAGRVLRIIFEERGLLRNETCPISPFLVIFLISIELKVRSLMSPELLATVTIGLDTIEHWALLAVAAIPMSCPSRRGRGCGWRRHGVWRS